MKIQLKNIGPISQAELEIGGLTVIGGLNNSGKSTVGKSLFLLIKAYNVKEQEFANERRGKVSEIISELISELRLGIGSNIGYTNINVTIDRAINGSSFQNISSDEIDGIISVLEERVLDIVRKNIYIRLRMRPNDPLEEEKISKQSTFAQATINKYLKKIKAIIDSSVDEKTMYETAFTRMISSVFQGEITNKRFRARQSIAALIDKNEENIIKVLIKGSKINAALGQDNTMEVFSDATFIESPYVLNNRTSSVYFLGNVDTLYVDYPAHDLLQKLNLAIRRVQSPGLETEVSSRIENTINGRVYFDHKSDDFVYKMKNGINIKISNTASGIKVLGMLQMLADSGALVPNSLLIIDEPEVHLHPEWQLVYAEIIAILVQKNIYCLVSSHSPYFIKALTIFAKKYEINELTKFYISQSEEEGVTFKDVTDDLEPIYSLLALPMQKLAFI